ncbi:MAG: sodium/proton-translocating pyrophosphatase, partial [Terriglobia bacterium]
MYLAIALPVTALMLMVAALRARQLLRAKTATPGIPAPFNAFKERAEAAARHMRAGFTRVWSQRLRIAGTIAAGTALLLASASGAFATPLQEAGGEANLQLPDFHSVQLLGMDAHRLLTFGILFCIFGLIFGLVSYSRLKNLPAHESMKEMSQLIWETCKTYLINQGKFLLLLWVFIAIIIFVYFGVLLKFDALRVIIILAFSVFGISGSYGVAWFGIRVNT